jgi:hypothetical protein
LKQNARTANLNEIARNLTIVCEDCEPWRNNCRARRKNGNKEEPWIKVIPDNEGDAAFAIVAKSDPQLFDTRSMSDGLIESANRISEDNCFHGDGRSQQRSFANDHQLLAFHIRESETAYCLGLA